MSENFKIYHNPRCRKSRETLEILKSNKIDPEIVLYLKNPPTPKELKLLLAKLDMKPIDVIRKEEREYKEKYRGMDFNEDEWLKVLHENPKLIQRPIVVKGSKAVMGRPPENVNDLL